MSGSYLVTGGAGSIGCHVVKNLVEAGEEVMVLDNLSAYDFDYLREFGLSDLNVRFIKGDVRDKTLISQIVPNVTRIIHMAAVADVAQCTRNPRLEFDVNIQGTQNLLDVALECDINKFTFVSSASVYGSSSVPVPQRKFSELQDCRPISNYGLSKLWGEMRCLLYYTSYKLPTTALRLFSVYGSPQLPKPGSHSWCIAIFAMQLRSGKPVTIFGDGEQIRDFVHVGDAADAIVLATRSEPATGKALNIGTGVPTSINDVCELISMLGRSSKRVQYLPRRDDDPNGGFADIEQCRSILGWQHTISLTDGIREYLDWLDLHEHLIPSFI